MASKSKNEKSEAELKLEAEIRAKESERQKLNQKVFLLNAQVGILKNNLDNMRLEKAVADIEDALKDAE